jgi:adenylate cyclase
VAEAGGAQAPIGIATMGTDARQFLLNFPGLLRNVPTLEQAASGRGLFTIRPERDGIIRRVPVVMLAQGAIMPSLTLEMLRVVSGSNTVLIRSDDAGVQSAAVPGFVIPTDRNGQLWIHFAPHDKARYVSAIDVLEGRIPPDRVAQRLVLIGTSAVGLLDSKTTPVDPLMPGVEVHAQVLENILTRSVLSSPNYAFGVELCAALLLGIIIIWLAPTLNPLVLLLVGGAIVAISMGASWYFLRPEQVAVRFHLPAAVERARLSHAGVQQLHERAGAAPSHPVGFRPISFACAGRAARAVARKARAGR